jgi:hypothetical protein
MRLTWCTLLFLIFCTCAQAQTSEISVWNKWCIHTDTPVLFSGANNLILIYSPQYKAQDLLVKSLDQSLKIGKPEIKGDTIMLMAMPYLKYSKRMRLAVLDAHTNKTLKTVSFTAESTPQPTARLGTIPAGEAIRKEMIYQSALRVSFDNSFYNYPYRVKSYVFKVSYTGVNVSIPVKGLLVPTDIVMEIKRAPEGATVTFTDIKATCPECDTRTLPDLNIKIKN